MEKSIGCMIPFFNNQNHNHECEEESSDTYILNETVFWKRPPAHHTWENTISLPAKTQRQRRKIYPSVPMGSPPPPTVFFVDEPTQFFFVLLGLHHATTHPMWTSVSRSDFLHLLSHNCTFHFIIYIIPHLMSVSLHRVYVGGLPPTSSEAELETLINKVVPVSSIFIPEISMTGQS